MTFIKRVAAMVAGLSLAAVPVAASAAPSAAKLSVTGNRAATPAAHANRIGSNVGGATLINIGILATLVVIVLVATGGDSDSN